MLQFGASLTDDTSIVIYNRIVFMIQATEVGMFLYDKSVDVKSVDDMSVDDMSVDHMSVDHMSVDHMPR
jgi:hypothetical protein